MGLPGHGLAGRLAKLSYLGSSYEYTFETELGPVFVVSGDWPRCSALAATSACSSHPTASPWCRTPEAAPPAAMAPTIMAA